MHEYINSPTWLLDVPAKASLLLAFVWLGSLFIRKRSAAAQHRWWTLGFVGCLLLPVVSLVAPTWTPPLIPAPIHFGKPTNETPDSPNTRTPVGVQTGARAIASQRPDVVPQVYQANLTHRASDTQSIPPRQQPSVSKVATIPTPATVQRIEFSSPKVLLILWGIGVTFALLRSVRQHWLLNRILSRCKRLEDATWTELLREASQILGIRKNIELLEHRQANSPVTAGVRRSVVVLPVDARNWNRERRRLVLLHELAHVARRDVLAQSLAGLGCGLQWFNPLAWYGLLQMRKLRELACDDMVLSCGQQATGYADVLLDIARSYRHQTYANAVGMAHCSDVESRIMAILDRTRRHVSLSHTAARMLFAFATALVCLVGTAQFRSQAETPDEKPAEKPAGVIAKEKNTAKPVDESGDESIRTMRIRILDEEGQPLAGALLRVGTWYVEGYDGYRVPKEHHADATGTVALRLPKNLEILRLWPKQKGYVGLFKNFGRGTHGQGELLPDEYEFRLAKGHPIGGQIVDEDGNPVEGVHVRVKVDGGPGVSTWLTDSFGQPTVKTDSEGRWQLGNAPAPRKEGCKFEIKLSHSDFVADKFWGESQRAQGIGTAEIRRGSAKIVIHRGTSIHGLVTDERGKPITKGWVVWNDEPYFFDGTYEAELQADGRFATPPLPDGEHPISIVAPGFAAQRRVVKVGSEPAEQSFELRPGKRIEIHFVNSAGIPVPNVGVGLARSSEPNTWQNSNALHNHQHPNVPDYGIPRRAKGDGVYVWDWAPEEPVRYSVGAKGFTSKEVALVPKSEPHIVTLRSARVATGTVTDETTGKPIEEFEAIPVIVYRPNFFHTPYSRVKKGANGRYELPLVGGGNPDYRYRVRIEAEGYRTFISEHSFGPIDGRVGLNVQLEPAPMRKGRVLDAEGKPVANASILEGTPTWIPDTNNGEPGGFGERIVQSDREGRFVLHATSEPVRLRVLHDTGIVEKLLQPGDSIGDLRLQPWAKVSGRLVQNGQPMGNQSIQFNPLVTRGLGEARFQDRYGTQTKPDGSFSFDRLPPGAGSIRPYLGLWRDSALTSAESLPLELKPGERREVVLGGEGAVLAGQVVATGRDDVPLDRKYSLNYLVSRDRAVRPLPADFPALSFDPSKPMEPSWSLDPRFRDWLATRENHFVKLTPDGDLRVTGVAPGNYDLLIQLYEQPAGCLVETVGEKIVPIQVKGDGNIDLGKIEVPCRAGPRPGSDMRAYEFVDSTGKKQSVSDMAGRHVLMHVWASWCVPCMESMPDIQHAVDDLAGEPVTFVGLNIDQDSRQASHLAKQMDWNWSQNFLGEDSDMARQLALSSVPSYYLIGPDGKLTASATEWADIKKQLDTSFTKTFE